MAVNADSLPAVEAGEEGGKRLGIKRSCAERNYHLIKLLASHPNHFQETHACLREAKR